MVIHHSPFILSNSKLIPDYALGIKELVNLLTNPSDCQDLTLMNTDSTVSIRQIMQ